MYIQRVRIVNLVLCVVNSDPGLYRFFGSRSLVAM
jgi:hypothetical protein